MVILSKAAPALCQLKAWVWRLRPWLGVTHLSFRSLLFKLFLLGIFLGNARLDSRKRFSRERTEQAAFFLRDAFRVVRHCLGVQTMGWGGNALAASFGMLATSLKQYFGGGSSLWGWHLQLRNSQRQGGQRSSGRGPRSNLRRSRIASSSLTYCYLHAWNTKQTVWFNWF